MRHSQPKRNGSTVRVVIYVDPETAEEIQDHANRDSRSLSHMAATLVKEALAARKGE